jgi:hypothetical protein
MSSETSSEPSFWDWLEDLIQYLNLQKVVDRNLQGYNINTPVSTPSIPNLDSIPSLPKSTIIGDSGTAPLFSNDEVRFIAATAYRLRGFTTGLEARELSETDARIANQTKRVWEETGQSTPFPKTPPPLLTEQEVRDHFINPLSEILQNTEGNPYIIAVTGACPQRECAVLDYFEGGIVPYRLGSTQLDERTFVGGEEDVFLVFNPDKLSPGQLKINNKSLIPYTRLLDYEKLRGAAGIDPAFKPFLKQGNPQ